MEDGFRVRPPFFLFVRFRIWYGNELTVRIYFSTFSVVDKPDTPHMHESISSPPSIAHIVLCNMGIYSILYHTIFLTGDYRNFRQVWCPISCPKQIPAAARQLLASSQPLLCRSVCSPSSVASEYGKHMRTEQKTSHSACPQKSRLP